MTGFARVRQAIPEGELVLSLKSVNHRGLDLHFHLPPEMDPLEHEIRTAIKRGVVRGHVQVHLTFTRSGEAVAGALNRPLLETYIRAFREAADLYGVECRPDLNAALRVPGMLASGAEEELSELLKQAVLEAAAEAVRVLNASREREGAAMAREIADRCRTLADLAARMEEIRAGAVEVFHNRLREKLADLLQGAGLDPQRLAQEAAILADRSDIAEELVRLRTHTAQLGDMIQTGGEIGKRLDFLLQEMNRESNTILSKTGGIGELGLAVTELALAAKSEIEKIREQSLNLE
jgi:uncharacterized protein (TIGR00255 family)